MAVKKRQTRDKLKATSNFKGRFIGQLVDLSTSGFGLVAALAWNQVIQEVVTQYIKPFFGQNSGLISLLIYAVLVTLLAVLVTYNLSRLRGTKQ